MDLCEAKQENIRSNPTLLEDGISMDQYTERKEREERKQRKRPESKVPKLTPRQEQVLGYLLQGMPNKVIAARLGMAEGTVKTHLYTIYRLFGASNRAQVILRASQLGLV